jgi:hypothetical protein
MMTRIFIEDNEIDVTDGFSHQITYAVDDLNNFDSKSTAFTKTIVIPGTNRNNRILGNIFEFSNSNFTNDADPNVMYNFNASKSAKARIEFNGTQVMKGVMRLMEIIIDGDFIEYEIALFGELGGFVAKLGAKKLTGNTDGNDDLNFDEYNHNWNIANVLGSWDRTYTYSIGNAVFNTILGAIVITSNRYYNAITTGDVITISGSSSNDGTYNVTSVFSMWLFANITFIYVSEPLTYEPGSSFTLTMDKPIAKGYIYPLIDYGNVSFNIPSTNPSTSISKKDYQFKAFRPAFFVREILDKIITNAGYTWESNFANTDFFQRLIVPNNEKALYKRGVTEYINASISSTQTFFGTDPLGYTGNIVWDSYTLNQFVVNGTDDRFTFTGSDGINTKCTLTITGSANIGNFCGGSVTIYKSGASIGSQLFGFTNGQSVSFGFVISGIEPIQPGEFLYVSVKIFGNPRRFWSGTINIDTATLLVVNDPPTYIEYQYDELINMSQLLPKNILQKDFVTSVMKMFNLMVTEDKYREKHLKIEPWIDFYNLDSYSYLDWSDKIDRSQVIKIKPMSEINARYYQLKYKSDADYYNDKYRKQYNEGYGDRIFDNQLEFAKDTESQDVIFSATPLVGYENRDKIVSTIFKMNNNVEESCESNIRILQVKKIDGVESWKILRSTTLMATQTSYCYAGHLDDPDVPGADLNFGATKELYFSLVSGALSNNLFNVFYSSYMAEITDKDSRLVTCKMKFSESDIFNLNFGTFIMCDGVLYRLIKISDYTANEICEVQLLRVIYTTYENTQSAIVGTAIQTEAGDDLQQENGFALLTEN